MKKFRVKLTIDGISIPSKANNPEKDWPEGTVLVQLAPSQELIDLGYESSIILDRSAEQFARDLKESNIEMSSIGELDELFEDGTAKFDAIVCKAGDVAEEPLSKDNYAVVKGLNNPSTKKPYKEGEFFVYQKDKVRVDGFIKFRRNRKKAHDEEVMSLEIQLRKKQLENADLMNGVSL